MDHSDFSMGQRFMCGGKEWLVTDIGTRTVIAITVKDDWMEGPPYALNETVFDENDMPGCSEIEK